MVAVLRGSWPLFLGLLLLMVGNGGQGAALGVRAGSVGISSETYGFVSAGYFAGFLLGSILTPKMIRRVGHVRVFAALGSLISAALIVYLLTPSPIVWLLMRVAIGFCYSGVYIVCESWLNESVANETRGQALGLYMFVQMIGVVGGQLMLTLGDPASFELFVVLSVLVSLSFAPILLSVTPAPIAQTSRPMSLQELYAASPLGCFGCFALGGVFGAMFGMSSIYGAEIGLNNTAVALFAAALYIGALFLLPVIGWISDRMDRRSLIILVALSGATFCVLGALVGQQSLGAVGEIEILLLYPIAVIAGAFINPIYALLAAHTNDYLENDQMASASSGLVFLNGAGALFGPIIVGFMMTRFGNESFWLFMAVLLGAMAVFGLYRMTQRGDVAVETAPFAPVTQRVSAVGAEMIQEVVIEQIEAQEEEEAAAQEGDANSQKTPDGGREGQRDGQ